MFSLICAWISGWVNDREAGDLRRHCVHYDVSVMHSWGTLLASCRVVKFAQRIRKSGTHKFNLRMSDIQTSIWPVQHTIRNTARVIYMSYTHDFSLGCCRLAFIISHALYDLSVCVYLILCNTYSLSASVCVFMPRNGICVCRWFCTVLFRRAFC